MVSFLSLGLIFRGSSFVGNLRGNIITSRCIFFRKEAHVNENLGLNLLEGGSAADLIPKSCE